MRREIVIDGSHFDDLEGFYDEVEKNFTKGLSWRIGRNLDALNDVLRGGFGVHEYGEPITVRWLHFDKSAADFGYPATQAYYEKMLSECHPANTPYVQQRCDEAGEQTGKTLMEMLVDIITLGIDSGHDCLLKTDKMV